MICMALGAIAAITSARASQPQVVQQTVAVRSDDGGVAMDAAQHAGSEQALASAMRDFSRTTCATMLVLSAMFIPMIALASSAVGEIYRQFMAAMVIAMWLTMLLVLAVAPALTRMWPRRAGRPIAASAASLPRRCARMFMLCAGFVAALVWALPSDSLVG
ncbi:efflux RND transporter permease subunit [Duganella lactea]